MIGLAGGAPADGTGGGGPLPRPLRLASASRARRVSSSFLRASAASRSSRSRASRSARTRASASWRLRSSSSRTRESLSARVRASRSSSVRVRRTTPVCGRCETGLTGGRAGASALRLCGGRALGRRRRRGRGGRGGVLGATVTGAAGEDPVEEAGEDTGRRFAGHGRGASPSRRRPPWSCHARSSGARRPARPDASAKASWSEARSKSCRRSYCCHSYRSCVAQGLGRCVPSALKPCSKALSLVNSLPAEAATISSSPRYTANRRAEARKTFAAGPKPSAA